MYSLNDQNQLCYTPQNETDTPFESAGCALYCVRPNGTVQMPLFFGLKKDKLQAEWFPAGKADFDLIKYEDRQPTLASLNAFINRYHQLGQEQPIQNALRELKEETDGVLGDTPQPMNTLQAVQLKTPAHPCWVNPTPMATIVSVIPFELDDTQFTAILNKPEYRGWQMVKPATLSKDDDGNYHLMISIDGRNIDLLSPDFLKHGDSLANIEWRGFAKILLKDYVDILNKNVFDTMLAQSPEYAQPAVGSYAN